MTTKRYAWFWKIRWQIAGFKCKPLAMRNRRGGYYKIVGKTANRRMTIVHPCQASSSPIFECRWWTAWTLAVKSNKPLHKFLSSSWPRMPMCSLRWIAINQARLITYPSRLSWMMPLPWWKKLACKASQTKHKSAVRLRTTTTLWFVMHSSRQLNPWQPSQKKPPPTHRASSGNRLPCKKYFVQLVACRICRWQYSSPANQGRVKSWLPVPYTNIRHANPNHLSRSIWRRFRMIWLKLNYLVMKKARLRVRLPRAKGVLSRRMAALYFWMKSATCLYRPKRVCCAS